MAVFTDIDPSTLISVVLLLLFGCWNTCWVPWQGCRFQAWNCRRCRLWPCREINNHGFFSWCVCRWFVKIHSQKKYLPLCSIFPPHSLSHPVLFLSPSSSFLPFPTSFLSFTLMFLLHTCTTTQIEGYNRMWSKLVPLTLMKRSSSWNDKLRCGHFSSYHRVVVPSYPPFFQLSFPHQFTLSPPIAISPSFLLAILLRYILLSSLATS